MKDETYKNLFDDGYTTYHEDGSKSKTYKNIFSDGYTTYHDDGSQSKTYKNIFSDGYTTYHDDGSKSKTYRNIFSDGYTTYHDNGDVSQTSRNLFGGGYTTEHERNDTRDFSLLDTYDTTWPSQRTYYPYLIFDNVPFINFFLVLIGAAFISWLCWLQAGKAALLPLVVFNGSIVICGAVAMRKKRNPYLWAWLFNIATSGSIMFICSTTHPGTDFTGSLVALLLPFGSIILLFWMNEGLHYEDCCTSRIFPSILMGASYGIGVQKYYSSFPALYVQYFQSAVILLFIIYAIVSLLLGIRNAKKEERSYKADHPITKPR